MSQLGIHVEKQQHGTGNSSMVAQLLSVTNAHRNTHSGTIHIVYKTTPKAQRKRVHGSIPQDEPHTPRCDK